MISRFLERKPQCLRPLFAGRAAKSGPGSYRSVSSLARQETPGYSANPAFRACGSAAKVTANPPPVRGRTGHAAFLRSARAGGCTPGMPASCLRQGRGVAPQACRLLACGKAGKGTAKPPARTVLSSRSSAALAAGAWPHGPCRLLAFLKGGGLHPRHAGFLPAARPERSPRN